MLAAAAERNSRAEPVVWFWFAPFAGLIAQTGDAVRAVAPGLRVRNPVVDRIDIGTRPGDVFIATWAGVASRTADSRLAAGAALSDAPTETPIARTLFGQLAEAQLPAPAPDGDRGVAPTAHPRTSTPGNRYPRKPEIPLPMRLRTEKMPRGNTVLLDALVSAVQFLDAHLTEARRSRIEIDRDERDLFDAARQDMRLVQAEISEFVARQHAHETLRVSGYIDPRALGQALLKKLAMRFREAGQDVPPEKELRRALNVVLVRFPTLLKDALRRATQACAEVIDAADLPPSGDSEEPLLPSSKNLYGIIPAQLNTWERRFANWLDREPRVRWWLRNLSRPTAKDDWSVRIVLPDTGEGFYPDFVICVEARKQRDGIALAETKERTETSDSAVKSRTEHREYGRALMLRYDQKADRFICVEYAPELGRNKEIGPLTPEFLLE
jgi:hypothetical protein